MSHMYPSLIVETCWDPMLQRAQPFFSGQPAAQAALEHINCTDFEGHWTEKYEHFIAFQLSCLLSSICPQCYIKLLRKKATWQQFFCNRKHHGRFSLAIPRYNTVWVDRDTTTWSLKWAFLFQQNQVSAGYDDSHLRDWTRLEQASLGPIGGWRNYDPNAMLKLNNAWIGMALCNSGYARIRQQSNAQKVVFREPIPNLLHWTPHAWCCLCFKACWG